MKKLKLTKGKFAIVDNEDFTWLNQWKWHSMGRYAYHSFKEFGWKEIAMHRLINKTPLGFQTDHINRNGLDNRKINLRTVTNSQNQHNTEKRAENTSGYKGVTFHRRDRYWQSSIRVNGKRFYLGSFKKIEDANNAYKFAERGIL